MINCLKLANDFRVTSLAFPPFGSGYLKYPEDVLADTMLQSVVNFERSNHSTKIGSLVIVCHRTQNSVFKVIMCPH
jgi:O-acetyl-ADP-ribose deacetylase (regulator of RNase III)